MVSRKTPSTKTINIPRNLLRKTVNDGISEEIAATGASSGQVHEGFGS
jgi:hypothetical protein